MILRFYSPAVLLLMLFLTDAYTQETLKYQTPPESILKIVDAPLTPGVIISPDKKHIILTDRAGIITISELSEDELRLAGLRINPLINGPSRQTYNKGFSIMNIDGSALQKIPGLPQNARLSAPSWSADGTRFAFTITTSESIELWVCELQSFKLTKIADGLNMVFSTAFSWLPGNRIVYRVVDPERGSVPDAVRVPEGPVVQENTGKQSQSRTYQDLIKDHNDEIKFEYYARSLIMLWDGNQSAQLGEPAIISEMIPSPDGKYLMTTVIEKPFSFTVPYRYFPSSIQILDMQGKLLRTLSETPLIEDIPRAYDMVLPGPRSFGWRDDKPSAVVWVEALDGGIYENKMQNHDQVLPSMLLSQEIL